MTGDFFTKPLPGSLFRKFRAQILNLDDTPSPDQKECVGTGDTRQGPGPEESRVGGAGVEEIIFRGGEGARQEIIFRGGEAARHQYTSPTR